jgi:hypothetical protein
MSGPSDRRSIGVPVRFNGRDFASVTGPALRQSQARHLLLTEPGELPWQTDFGAGLGRLRHQRLNAVLVELARIDVRDAFRRWLPAVVAEGVVAAAGDRLVVRVTLTENGHAVVAEVTT